MKKHEQQWGERSRFYLPNEDAAMVRRAVALLKREPRTPVFVGGSGMVLLDVIPEMTQLQQATFVDISDFQVAYFKSLLFAMKGCATAEELWGWFQEVMYPQLHHHFSSRRNQVFSLDQVRDALEKLFRIRFFFDPEPFGRAKSLLPQVNACEMDIVSYLAEPAHLHDFIYLSNVPDYLPEHQLRELFASCRSRHAPVYLLLTEACPQPALVRQAWEEAGYRQHEASATLTEENCGLGSFKLKRSWNRIGRIVLLVP